MTELRAPAPKVPILQSIRETWVSILQTGGWIWRTKTAFALVLFGLVFDSVIRLFLTVASNFYRLVGIEEGWYGVIGTGLSLLGLVTASLMEKSAQILSARQNFIWLGLVVFGGLMAAAHPQPGWAGIALVVPLFLSMRFLQFYLSHYLNEIVDSEQRATALSFRGLTVNLAYGILTLLFGWQTSWVAGHLRLSAEDPRVFSAALKLWPWWFVGTALVAGFWVLLRVFSSPQKERIERIVDTPGH